MPIRRDAVSEAARRAERQLADVIRTLVDARRAAGLSQAFVAGALGVSRPTVAAWEAARVTPSSVQLGRWGAVVGLDVGLRAFPGGSPLRDAAQLRLLDRFHRLVGNRWAWRTEVPVSRDPRDRRAIDATLVRDGRRVGVEAVTRLVDIQGQTRPILLKQEASGIGIFVLVLSDSGSTAPLCQLARRRSCPPFHAPRGQPCQRSEAASRRRPTRSSSPRRPSSRGHSLPQWAANAPIVLGRVVP